MRVRIKKLREDATIPVMGSPYAAGVDLYACTNHNGVTTIQPHQTMKVGTGIAMEIPRGFFGAIFARSGMATNKGLRPANCVGVVDSDYRGEIIVALHNDTENKQTYANGERIAQLVLIPYLPVEFEETDTLNETWRGSGGFGSTGRFEAGGAVDNTKLYIEGEQGAELVASQIPGQMSLFAD